MYSRRELAAMLVGAPVAVGFGIVFKKPQGPQYGGVKRFLDSGWAEYDLKSYGWVTTIKNGKIVKQEPLGW